MTPIPANILQKLASPITLNIKKNLEIGDAVFLGIISSRDESKADQYIIQNNFLVDEHGHKGIREFVPYGVIDSKPGEQIYALGVWEVEKVSTGKVTIKPTWELSELDLRNFMKQNGFADESFVVFGRNRQYLEDLESTGYLLDREDDEDTAPQ